MIKAHIAETRQSAYSVKIDVNGHVIVGDEPTDKGGENLGPAPYDLLLAALGECTAMTVRWFAIKKNWPLGRVSVDLTHEKRANKIGVMTDYFSKTILIEGDELTDEQRLSLHDVAAKCPVQKTLMSDVAIETK